MTNTERIKAEIERRRSKAEWEKNEAVCVSHDGYCIHMAEENLCMFLLSFIESLEQEQRHAEKSEKPIIPDNIPIYFKIPITTKYSEDLSLFDKSVTNVVEGTEFCEKDPYGDSCCCWYVSTIFGTSDDKEWLLHEIAELGYNPTFVDFRKGLFRVMKPNNQ